MGFNSWASDFVTIARPSNPMNRVTTSFRSNIMSQNCLAELIRTACILEAQARKPGNVHPAAAFSDLCYDDFVLASQAVAEVLPAAAEIGVGKSILQAVIRTRELVNRPTNPNLGIILLLAPLAAVPAAIPL